MGGECGGCHQNLINNTIMHEQVIHGPCKFSSLVGVRQQFQESSCRQGTGTPTPISNTVRTEACMSHSPLVGCIGTRVMDVFFFFYDQSIIQLP